MPKDKTWTTVDRGRGATTPTQLWTQHYRINAPAQKLANRRRRCQGGTPRQLPDINKKLLTTGEFLTTFSTTCWWWARKDRVWGCDQCHATLRRQNFPNFVLKIENNFQIMSRAKNLPCWTEGGVDSSRFPAKITCSFSIFLFDKIFQWWKQVFIHIVCIYLRIYWTFSFLKLWEILSWWEMWRHADVVLAPWWRNLMLDHLQTRWYKMFALKYSSFARIFALFQYLLTRGIVSVRCSPKLSCLPRAKKPPMSQEKHKLKQPDWLLLICSKGLQKLVGSVVGQKRQRWSRRV